MRDVEHLEIHGAYFSATGDRVVERQPYIRLRDAATQSADLLLCYFESREAAGLGGVTTGMSVTVTGDFQRYDGANDQFLVVMMGHCALN